MPTQQKFLIWIKWDYEEGKPNAVLSVKADNIEAALYKAETRYAQSYPRSTKTKFYDVARMYARVEGNPERYFSLGGGIIKELRIGEADAYDV